MLTVFALAQVGMSFSFKLVTDNIMADQQNGKIGFNLVWPILLFFAMICMGGNTSNFTNMLITLYTSKAKKIFHKLFMSRSYHEKQDNFYDSKFYDTYSFVNNNIDNTSNISITIFNDLFGAIIALIISSVAITVFSPIILPVMIIIAVITLLVNKYTVKKRINLNYEYINDERKAGYFSNILSEKPYVKEV